MSYSIKSLKIALGMAVLENTKLDKVHKVAVLEFVQNGTDAQIKHLALTGEVKYKFTKEEKLQINEKYEDSKFSSKEKKIIREFIDDMNTAGKVLGGVAVAGTAALVGGQLLKNRRAKIMCKKKYPNDEVEYTRCVKQTRR